MEKIVLGGSTPVIFGGHAGYQYDRYSEWYKRDPARAVDDALGDRRDAITNEKTLVSSLVHTWRLSASCAQFLGQLHEQIAKFYLRCIDDWKEKHPDEASTINEVDEQHSANYTEAMTRIRNLRFEGWNHENIKGFCLKEPVVRIMQLLDFPIDHFAGNIKTASVNFPEQPDMSASEKKIVDVSSTESAHAAILDARPLVDKWETYYRDLCRELQRFAELLPGL